MPETLMLENLDGVARITLDRPQQLNSLSVRMMQELLETVQALGHAADWQVLVVRGAGAHFMAGGDVKEFHGHLGLSPDARLATFRAMIEQWINPLVLALRAMHQPVIAEVRGACAGFGLSLMLACDLALSADDATYTIAYPHIGLPADGGASWNLPRVVGGRKAAELMLLADRFDATTARELGLVNRVVPAADLEAEVLALARRLQSGPRHAYAEIKRLLNNSPDASLGDQLQEEALAFARCSATQDFVEGVSAFVDKRKARFVGK